MAWQICLGIFLFCTIFWRLTNVIIPGTSKAFEDMTTRKNMTKKEKEKMFKMWRDYTKHKKNDYIDFRDMLEKEDIKLYNLACNKYNPPFSCCIGLLHVPAVDSKSSIFWDNSV